MKIIDYVVKNHDSFGRSFNSRVFYASCKLV